MDDDGDLFADLGVTARNANQVEEQIIQEALGGAGADELPAASEPPDSSSLEELRGHLQTVAQEIQTIDLALQEEGEEGEAAAAPGGPLQLQQAVMRDRLSGLQQERARLQAQLQQLVAAHDTDAAGRAGDGLPSLAPLRPAAEERDAEPDEGRPQKKARRQGAAARQQQQQSVQLVPDEDLFGDEEAPRAPPGQLLETEKDRLIRLGLMTPFGRLDGFERKVTGGRRAAAVAAGGGASRSSGSGSDDLGDGGHPTATAAGGAAGQPGAQRSGATPRGGKYQGAGHGALAHFGRAELTAEERARITRSGMSVAEYLQQAGRAALEARAARRTTQFVDPELLPQQEREARNISPQFWHQAASGKKVSSHIAPKARRASTLPRKSSKKAAAAKKRRRSKGEAAPEGEVDGEGDGDGEGGSEGGGPGPGRGKAKKGPAARRRRRRRSAGAGGSGDEEDDGEVGEDDSDYSPTGDGGNGGAASDDGDADGLLSHEGRRRGGGPRLRNGQRSRSKKTKGGMRRKGSSGAAGGDGHGGGGSSDGDSSECYSQDGGDEVEYDDEDDDLFEQRLQQSIQEEAAARAARRQRRQQRRRRRRGRQRQHPFREEGEASAPARIGAYGAADADSGDGDPVSAGGRSQSEEPDGGGDGAEAAAGGGGSGEAEGGDAGANGDAGDGVDGVEGNGDDDDEPDVEFEGGLRVPSQLYARLFGYQQTAVKWLWELHNQRAGGILGDEMGLGKTVQVIAFLAALHHSGLYRPSLVVCPATVLRQWMRELRAWWPAFRVILFHDSAPTPPHAGPRPDKASLLDKALRSDGGLLLATYDQLRIHRGLLLRARWGYCVLDEGHKIRNPDSEITLVCKQLHTVHRIIMSGSPIQNRLSELWSLLDFTFPGKLGTLPVFQAQFAVPITVGGYANASQLQVTAAYKCALVLRDLIAPYLLRRRKADVATHLPKKTEQVLFCTLVPEQLELYRAYLASKEVGEILAGSRQALAGIDILRKVCNHPDLLERAAGQDAADYGNPCRSGKLRVAERVLQAWQAAGHKALVFAQTQQMLDILEKMVRARGWRYHRMDGCTGVAMRPRLMDDFNNNPQVFAFLLTTKVGGIGVNLTGADRVLLYDPDWNPSTDTQARERAWRIGQQRPVVIYRLITSGTIEEKVYHRQIYKNFLQNKVLRDPRQKRFFNARDISELFTLGEEYKARPRGRGGPTGHMGGCEVLGGNTETARIFGSALALELGPPGEGQDAGERGSGGDVGHAGAMAAAAEGLRHRGEGREGAGATERHDAEAEEYIRRADGAAPGPSSSAAAAAAAAGQHARHHHRPHREGAGGSSADGVRRSSHAGAPAAGVSAVADAGEAQGIDGGGSAADDESKILRELFDGSGIRSLVDHHKIESANDPEVMHMHSEAQRIAQRAAEALRRSRQACRAASVSTPTWTGRHGSAGAPVPAHAGGAGGGARPRFGTVTNHRLLQAGAGGGIGQEPAAGGSVADPGSRSLVDDQQFSGVRAGAAGASVPSSQALLAQMRARQQAVAAAAADAAHSHHNTAAATELADALVAQLVSFFDARGGRAGSEEVVDAFRTSVPPQHMPLFKQLLKQVAGLRRRAGGGEWVLKAQYAEQQPVAAGGAAGAARAAG